VRVAYAQECYLARDQTSDEVPSIERVFGEGTHRKQSIPIIALEVLGLTIPKNGADTRFDHSPSQRASWITILRP